MRQTIGLALLIALGVGAGLTTTAPAQGAEPKGKLTPLVLGWERYFTVEWEPVVRKDRHYVRGYINNSSPYQVHRIRVLVDDLDAQGRVSGQHIGWVPGVLGTLSRIFFEVPVAQAPSYRVQVFAYDRVETDSLPDMRR